MGARPNGGGGGNAPKKSSLGAEGAIHFWKNIGFHHQHGIFSWKRPNLATTFQTGCFSTRFSQALWMFTTLISKKLENFRFFLKICEGLDQRGPKSGPKNAINFDFRWCPANAKIPLYGHFDSYENRGSKMQIFLRLQFFLKVYSWVGWKLDF